MGNAKQASKSRVDADLNGEIIEAAARFQYDPQAWARFAWDWDEGELEGIAGPRAWQADINDEIRQHLNSENRYQPLQIAVASGHGIGKSAQMGMMANWAMSCFADCKIVVTANTETQLRTKTSPEVGKWFRSSITSHWFETQAMSIKSRDRGHADLWRLDFVAWSANNTEAFAGLHNKDRIIVLMFDEASKITDSVWEVAEGALTDENTIIIWIVFGNPTQNTGRFRECFRRHRRRWIRRQIDSRTVPGTNKKKLAEWVSDYGEDSDFVKVRVRGMFPSTSAKQFISTDDVDAAQKVHLRKEQYDFAPKIIGVDPAWTGDDELVIYLRQGLYRDKLSNSDWQTVTGWRQSVVAGNRKDIEEGKTFADGMKEAQQALAAAGLTTAGVSASSDPAGRQEIERRIGLFQSEFIERVKIFQTANKRSPIRAVLISALGDVSDLSLESGDYAVTGVGNEAGGNVVKARPLLVGQTLTLVRRLPLTQDTSLENQGAYYPEVVEQRFDLLAMQIQSVNEATARALTVEPGQDKPSMSLIAAAEAYSKAAEQGRNEASGFAGDASKWASNPEDVPVANGLFSAFHWAKKAMATVTGKVSKAGDFLSGALKFTYNYPELWFGNAVTGTGWRIVKDTPEGQIGSLVFQNSNDRFAADYKTAMYLGANGEVNAPVTRVITQLRLPDFELNGGAFNGFLPGSGDSASYSTYNFSLSGWYGMGMRTYDGTINGYYDFRAGIWDTKGGFKVNGRLQGIRVGAKVIPPGTAALLYTGIPAEVYRFTVHLQNVTFSANAQPLIRIGTSAGVVQSSYSGMVAGIEGNVGYASVALSGGVALANDATVQGLVMASVTFTRVPSTNTWSFRGQSVLTNGSRGLYVEGTVTLSGEIDRVQLSTAAGTANVGGTSMWVEWENAG